jgi:hypothetical protein
LHPSPIGPQLACALAQLLSPHPVVLVAASFMVLPESPPMPEPSDMEPPPSPP